MYDSINSMVEDDFALETDYEQVQSNAIPLERNYRLVDFQDFFFKIF